MRNCGFISGCLFFNDQMASMPSTSGVFKMMYCNDNFEKCARYMVATGAGKEAVLDDLFPNQQDRAKQILGNR